MLTKKLKNLFVQRQRIMLEKYELSVCTCCPRGKNYSPGGIFMADFDEVGWDVCDFCAYINGIYKPTKYFHDNYALDEDNTHCPCHNYPPEEAVKRAWAAVLRWEKENK